MKKKKCHNPEGRERVGGGGQRWWWELAAGGCVNDRRASGGRTNVGVTRRVKKEMNIGNYSTHRSEGITLLFKNEHEYVCLIYPHRTVNYVVSSWMLKCAFIWHVVTDWLNYDGWNLCGTSSQFTPWRHFKAIKVYNYNSLQNVSANDTQ